MAASEVGCGDAVQNRGSSPILASAWRQENGYAAVDPCRKRTTAPITHWSP